VSYTSSKKFLKTEIIVSSILFFSAVVFSLEPTREFFLQTVMESQYQELETYKKCFFLLERNNVKEKDLKNLIQTLCDLGGKNRFFILNDDVELLKAKAYERIKDYKKSKDILLGILENGENSLSKTDAMLELSTLYEKEDRAKKALKMIEENKNISPYYKKDEVCFTLARLYYLQGQTKLAGKAIAEISFLEEDCRDFYSQAVRDNWGFYSQAEKKFILNSLNKMGLNDESAVLSIRYINEYKTDFEETEALALEMLSHPGKFRWLLALKESYPEIAAEMESLLRISEKPVKSHSSSVRGYYYYQLLRKLSKKARYNDSKALSYYENFLDGNIDTGYARKNLEFTIRNLLAFKKYDAITNVIEKTYQKLNLISNYSILSEGVSFWEGYSYLQMKEYDAALKAFEGTISKTPDGYYAFYAKNFIQQILEKEKIPFENYIHTLEKNFSDSDDTALKLYLGKILYVWKDNSEKEAIKERILFLNKKLNPDEILEWDSGCLKKMKKSENYVQFMVHTRLGLIEKAKAILSSEELSDPNLQNFLVLQELVRNKDFKKASPLYSSLADESYLKENFPFLPKEWQILLYPTPYDSEIKLALSKLGNRLTDKSLVYAVIRGESMFIPNARSWAGARGLMQIMPSTARLISKKALDKKKADLYNPLHNIILGSFFLNDNIINYGLLKAVASYNGGIRIIEKTKAKFHPANDIELMELIPYQETREYVKKVFCNYFRYKDIYESSTSGFAAMLYPKKEMIP
jgi:soluble lytic murein transglycosylase-like protein